MRASLSSRSRAEASRSAIEASHWPSSAENAPTAAECTAMTPNAPVRPRIAAPAGVASPRPRGAGGAAQPTAPQGGAVEAPLARPLPNDDGLAAGDDPAGEQAVRVGQMLGVCVLGDGGAAAGRKADAIAAGDELEDRAVLDAERLRDERDGLVEERLAVGHVERHAAEAAHRRLAAGALGLGGGAARLRGGAACAAWGG